MASEESQRKAQELADKLTDAGVPAEQALDWIHGLMFQAWWAGWHQGHRVGETETIEGTINFEQWIGKEETP